MRTGAARAARPKREETSAPPSAAEVFKNRLRFNDTIHLSSSNGLSRPKILDLGRSVAEPGEDVVVVPLASMSGSFEASSRVLIGAVRMSAPHSRENGERYRVINYKVWQDRMTTIVGIYPIEACSGRHYIASFSKRGVVQ